MRSEEEIRAELKKASARAREALRGKPTIVGSMDLGYYFALCWVLGEERR